MSFPEAMQLAVSFAPAPPSWTYFKDVAVILSPFISLFILGATLGLQKYYRNKDRENKAKSAAYYAGTNIEEWGNSMAVATLAWMKLYDQGKFGRYNVGALPKPPTFDQLRDLHEMPIDQQEKVVKMSISMTEVYSVIQNYTAMGDKSGDWATYNAVIIFAASHISTKCIAASQLLKNTYKLPPAPTSIIDKLAPIVAWEEANNACYMSAIRKINPNS